MLCPAWLGLPWAPERKVLGCAPHLGRAGERREERPCLGVGVPEGSARGCPPSLHGTAEGIACHGREVWFGWVWFAGICIPWARAESQPRGVCREEEEEEQAAKQREGPSQGSSPLESLPTSHVTAGTTGTFPELVSPVNSCCDVSSFLLSLSLGAFAVIHVCLWQQMAVHIKQTTVPFPWGGRHTIPVQPWKQLKAVPGFSPAHFFKRL